MPPRDVALAVLLPVIWGANFVVIDLDLGWFPSPCSCSPCFSTDPRPSPTR